MSYRHKTNQSIHDLIVCKIAKKLKKKGYKVYADADCGKCNSGRPPAFPEKLKGCEDADARRPDIFAVKKGSSIIVEVETEDTISIRRTRCQLTIFSKKAPTIVVVPYGNKGKMEENLKLWGLIDVKVIAIPLKEIF